MVIERGDTYEDDEDASEASNNANKRKEILGSAETEETAKRRRVDVDSTGNKDGNRDMDREDTTTTTTTPEGVLDLVKHAGSSGISLPALEVCVFTD